MLQKFMQQRGLRSALESPVFGRGKRGKYDQPVFTFAPEYYRSGSVPLGFPQDRIGAEGCCYLTSEGRELKFQVSGAAGKGRRPDVNGEVISMSAIEPGKKME